MNGLTRHPNNSGAKLMDIQTKLAGRTNNMKASAIRELLKLATRPGMISLGGGYPAPESFPLDMLNELTERTVEKYAARSLQYGPTEGFLPFRKALESYLRKKEIDTNHEDILVTSGSQGFLDAIGKVFISPGDCIAVEAPTYLGALQAFNAYEPNYIRMETDEDGVSPDSIEEILKKHPIKFIYLVPTFQNPTGRTIPLNRRRIIADIIRRHDALLIEDDPYSELRYRGSPVPTLRSLAPDNVVYASTLSKIFAPGLRIGFCIAPESVRKWLVLSKQGVDLHTSSYTQALAAEYISGGYLEKQLPKIIGIYKPRQEAMLNAMQNYLPDGFTWSKPEGGMFIWVEGPKNRDMETVYSRAVERNVAFVPGKYFFTSKGEGVETIRLNFTNTDEASIEKAIRILSEVIREEIV